MIFFKSRTWTAAIGHNSAAARFQWNCVWGSRFSQNFGNGIGAGVPWNVCYCFLNAVWASATGAFYIVSHTLVTGSQKVGKIVYYFAVLTLATWWRVYQTVTLTVTLVLASLSVEITINSSAQPSVKKTRNSGRNSSESQFWLNWAEDSERSRLDMSMSAKCDRIVWGLAEIFLKIAFTDSQSRCNIQTKACMRLLANDFKHKT